MTHDALRVVLVSPRNPLNIGAAARAMSNFGFLRLRLVNAYDVAYREAKSAVGASAVLQNAELFESVAESVADCGLVVGTASLGHRQPAMPLHLLPAGAAMLREAAHQAPVALLFGSEKFGLSNDDMSHCRWLMRIPTRLEHESMNLGQAVAVCLYELARQTSDAAFPPAAPDDESTATGELRSSMSDCLHEILAESSYPLTDSSPGKLRRLVNRMHLNRRDAQMWMGMFRQIRWRLRREIDT